MHCLVVFLYFFKLHVIQNQHLLVHIEKLHETSASMHVSHVRKIIYYSNFPPCDYRSKVMLIVTTPKRRRLTVTPVPHALALWLSLSLCGLGGTSEAAVALRSNWRIRACTKYVGPSSAMTVIKAVCQCLNTSCVYILLSPNAAAHIA